ncbi:MAG: GTP-binding protein, partial [Actinomycetota bacterium]|nr:GTP-binding protein [Actinomycetota bacterium]
GQPPDAIVLELSGASDAVEVAQVVEGLPDVRLDGVVAVVDASEGARQLTDRRVGSAMVRQIDAAHVVVLSKLDLITDASAASLVEELAAVAPGRPVLRSRRKAADASVLLGAATRGARPQPRRGGHVLDAHAAVVDMAFAVTRPRLAAALDALPEGVLRVKGWCELVDPPADAPQSPVPPNPVLTEVQAVGRRWTLDIASPPPPDRQLALTVIAADADSLAAAEAQLAALCEPAGPSKQSVS